MMFRLLAMDVDGTLTDGSVFIDAAGNEFKRFDIQDGMGMALFRKAGGKVAWISGRFSAVTELRARELHVDFLANGVAEKLPVLRKIAAEAGVTAGEVIFIGDDVNDRECVRWAGLGVAVANAVPALKASASHVTQRSGGSGAIREVVDMVLASEAEEG
ncbi:HAD hydrolase family protein [Pyramidobacter sp. YE332]|uniref:KdsC family phosphatase n=1 Tax=unclassified Pyramidobacter TaxID=2632171 RepID=UPI00268A43A0|nr:HAD hydrolase family protein [Pyramidobacter sp. YE332]WOL41111.1 HAD hydrolase family protein [Pyramidobacter sp. YE332]